MSATSSPFHPGEHAVQERLGVREIEAWARKVVRPFLPGEHRAFYEAQPFVIAASRDRAGRPWATVLAGDEGFIASPDERSLSIGAVPVPGDALEGALPCGADLGLLGIEFSTRRRNRVNGRVTGRTGSALDFAVDQAFGNCPQYIHERRWHRVSPTPEPARRGTRLSRSQRAWIETADTFFIASGHREEGESATYGMDASHRGGAAGFVSVESGSRLVFPDYAGNNHFNTLGNLEMDPRAGLLFVDFERGSLLQLTGRTRIDWNSPAVSRVPDARRLIGFEIEEIVEVQAALSIRWTPQEGPEFSLRLVSRVRESADVTSFRFESSDGKPLPAYEAGQHLPISLDLPDQDDPVNRTYTLSGDPADGDYRLSIKREALGRASRGLHDGLEVGGLLSANRPAGDFVLGDVAHDGAPVVLISAGIGVTPMVAFLHALSAMAPRPVWFIHTARNGEHHALAEEVAERVRAHPHLQSVIHYTRPTDEDFAEEWFDRSGRWRPADLDALGVPGDAHYYLCGPLRFMADVQQGLESRGIAADHIHSESFGPVGETSPASAPS